MDEIIHVSQASLGEFKKSVESVPIFVEVNEKKIVLGTLSSDKYPQIPFDLVFEKEFELSHNWTGGSVYFIGYRTVIEENDDYSAMGTDSDDELPISLEENGKRGAGPVTAKPAVAKAISAAKGKAEEKDSDSDEDSDEDDESMGADSDEEEGTDSEAGSDDDDEEETPKKAEVGKKRPVESASKTPDTKKAKLTTPQKTDGKKGVHAATPHPAKQVAKGPASSKKQQQTPKSAGAVNCNSCGKTFNSENALQSHSKAKHAAK